MGLKSVMWFYGECLMEERGGQRLYPLAKRALDRGIIKDHKTRGHVAQACGAVQRFLQKYPHHIATIRAAAPNRPFKPTGQVLADWKTFFAKTKGKYGKADFHYNYDTLRGLLTPKYGGTRRGGGGGDNEFEIVLRLCAEFV